MSPTNGRSQVSPRRPTTGATRDDGAGQGTWHAAGDAAHIVQFYETDAVLLDAVGDFIGTALHDGDAGIVIGTAAHRAGLAERLRASRVDVAAATADGRYVALDAAEMLTRFMSDGMPDPAPFERELGEIIARTGADGRRVRAFGEMVALLAVDGNLSAAIRLEALWNELQQTLPFALFCAYPMDDLGGAALGEALHDVCAAHNRVLPAESYTSLATQDDRDRAVAVLQQKARWLTAEIAERKRAEERLEAALAAERTAREAAEAALRVRDEFLASAAHELRTPLASLAVQAQVAQRRLRREERPEPARIVPALEAITVQTARLSGLVDRLLDVSRLETGKLTLDRQPTNLAALATRAVADARLWSDRHTIVLSAPPILNAVVDAIRIEQILANLLENAIKYSPGGPIEVVLSQPTPIAIEVAVRDHGPGIPLEQREQIFARFAQFHGDQSRGGLGLGLYVSRQLVALHGGDIRVECPADGGTRVVVHLPYGPAATAKAAD